MWIMQPKPWRCSGQLPIPQPGGLGRVGQGWLGWGGSALPEVGQGPPLMDSWWPGRSWEGEKPPRLWLGRGSMSWGQSLNPARMGMGSGFA